MQIIKDSVVLFNFTIKDDNDELLESSEDGPASYIHGIGVALPGIENSLEGKETGYKTVIKLSAEDAFGEYEEEMVVTVPKSEFEDEELSIGMEFMADSEGEGDEEETLMWRVIEIEGDEVTLDANHPYAGLNLVFDIEVVDVRMATPEEIEHGHTQDELSSH